MTTQVDNALIHFPEWYDERGEWEAEAKGWLPGVRVELANGASYPFVFYDPVRLAQDIEAEGSDAVISELGLVVVPVITRTSIVRAIGKLIANGYFNQIRTPPLPIANGVGH